MAATVTDTCTFPIFSSLPQEIRNQIWRDALPDISGPALYFYESGHWCSHQRSETDEGSDPNSAEVQLDFDFRYDRLKGVQIEVPLVSFNREARDIGLAWVRQHNLGIRQRQNRQYPVFVRSFDLTNDALYISIPQWEDFVREPYNCFAQPHLSNRTVVINEHVTRLALSGAHFGQYVELLYEFFPWFSNLTVLFVIINPVPELPNPEGKNDKERLWRFGRTPGGSAFWHGHRGSFDVTDCKYIRDGALLEDLCDELVKNRVKSFEIRPVYVFK